MICMLLSFWHCNKDPFAAVALTALSAPNGLLECTIICPGRICLELQVHLLSVPCDRFYAKKNPKRTRNILLNFLRVEVKLGLMIMFEG